MKYKRVSIGRTFFLRFEHGEDLLDGIKRFVRKEKIRFATVAFLGAMRSGKLVAGPKDLKLPARPSWFSFDDGREVLGFGTVLAEKGSSHVHVHLTLGKKGKAVTGCIRDNAVVFITVEAVVTELLVTGISRKKDMSTGHVLLDFGR